MIVKSILKTNPLLSDRIRLAIMASLFSAKTPLDFTFLLKQLNLTRGNLSSHIRKLEKDDLIEVFKEFKDRRPRTTYLLTQKGKKDLKKYLRWVEKLIKNN